MPQVGPQAVEGGMRLYLPKKGTPRTSNVAKQKLVNTINSALSRTYSRVGPGVVQGLQGGRVVVVG